MKLRLTDHPLLIHTISRYFASNIRKGPSNKYREDYKLSYTNLHVRRLGHPYDHGMLCDQEIDALYDCNKECINGHTVATYGRVSPEFIYEEPVDSRHLTGPHFRNLTFVEEYNEIQETCSRSCLRQSCKTRQTLATNDWLFKRVEDAEREITVRVGQPSSPFVKIEYYPKDDFYDVFIYVMSTLGSWLGLVLIKLDPFIFYRKICHYIEEKKAAKRRSMAPFNITVNNIQSEINLIHCPVANSH